MQNQFGDSKLLTRLGTTKEAVVAFLTHLNDTDSFGLIIFDKQAKVQHPLSQLIKEDVPMLKRNILNILEGDIGDCGDLALKKIVRNIR